jgi:hypothetical protein
LVIFFGKNRGKFKKNPDRAGNAENKIGNAFDQFSETKRLTITTHKQLSSDISGWVCHPN